MQAKYWREYCQLEIEQGGQEVVKELFGKCLLVCLDVELWSLYVHFIKMSVEGNASGGGGAPELKSALEFALEHVGQDVFAGPLWEECISFYSNVEDDSPLYGTIFGQGGEGQGDAAKVAMLRRTYHRALVVPTASLDTLWAAYEKFENGLGNKTLAKRILDEWRPKYHASKGTFKERLEIVEALDTEMLPLPPGKGGSRQMHAAAAWRNYCVWERGNPGELDDLTYQARVVLAYEQSLGYLVQFPDVWLDYASWHTSGRGLGVESAITVLDRGREALPSALILHFTAADLDEAEGNVEKARAVYETLVTSEDVPTEGQQEEESEKFLTRELKTLAWIQYMRFVRRVDGLMASRKLFMRARKWPGLQWQAFVASARFEWANEGKDHIPRNIFELGLKSFLQVPGYVLEYASFLQGIGDMANARSLYERALTVCSGEESGPLWDAYISFEAECGPLSTVSALEERRKHALDSAKDPLEPLHVALLKYRFVDLVPGESDMLEVHPDLYPEEEYEEEYQQADEFHPSTGMHQSRPQQRGRIPRDLHHLMKQLSGEPDGPVPDIDSVLDPILNFDFSLGGVDAHEAAMSRARRKQREASQPQKRKSDAVPVDPRTQNNAEGSDDDFDDEDDEEMGAAGMDVYRRRMRARN